jgi:5'-nucleotidase (lipoprotein e(P4) family)
MKNFRLFVYWIAPATFFLFLNSCQVKDQEPSENVRETHEQLNGTLWMQTSIEYDVTCVQAYEIAKVFMLRGLEDRTWTAAIEQKGSYEDLPPAVILDLDETVLDNSAFQARLAKQGIEYNPDLWSKWVQESQAGLISGAKEFIQLAQEREVRVFFVTNREFVNEDYTLRNLETVLNMSVDPEQILNKNELADWGSDKTSRRAFLSENFRILLLIGDDFNDFVCLGELPPGQRTIEGAQYKPYWGSKWIQLPNPLYGNWERAIYRYDNKLSDAEKLKLKYETLDTRLLSTEGKQK